MYHMRFWLLLVVLSALVLPVRAEQPQASSSTAFLPLVIRGVSPFNLDVLTATYLGGVGADQGNAAAIAPDGSVLIAGALPGYNPNGATVITLFGGGDAAIVRLSSDGTQALSITRLGGTGGVVNDMEMNAAGQLVVCGNFGVVRLSSDAATPVWSNNLGNAPGARCSIGSDGIVAVLSGSAIYLFDAGGAFLTTWNVAGNRVNDIAVASGASRVIATGYVQISGNLQTPFLRAYSYTGALDWKVYDFASVSGYGADARGERVAIGLDGKLYLAGSINGGTGASVFSRNPRDFTQPLPGGVAVVTDNYTNPFNVGSVSMAWFGRFNPTNGDIELAQSLLTRLSSGRGNSISIRAIAADETGRVFLAGDTSCCIKDRDGSAGVPQKLQVAGVTIGNYEGGEAFFLATSADFRTRLAWSVFPAPGVSGGTSPANGVAARGNNAVMAATLTFSTASTRGLITSANALQQVPGGSSGSEAYLVVWPVR